jgi:hypothetical protein
VERILKTCKTMIKNILEERRAVSDLVKSISLQCISSFSVLSKTIKCSIVRDIISDSRV